MKWKVRARRKSLNQERGRWGVMEINRQGQGCLFNNTSSQNRKGGHENSSSRFSLPFNIVSMGYDKEWVGELLLAPLKLLLALTKGLKLFIFQKYPIHGIMIPLNKMHNRFMISLCTSFRPSLAQQNCYSIV